MPNESSRDLEIKLLKFLFKRLSFFDATEVKGKSARLQPWATLVDVMLTVRKCTPASHYKIPSHGSYWVPHCFTCFFSSVYMKAIKAELSVFFLWFLFRTIAQRDAAKAVSVWFRHYSCYSESVKVRCVKRVRCIILQCLLGNFNSRSLLGSLATQTLKI